MDSDKITRDLSRECPKTKFVFGQVVKSERNLCERENDIRAQEQIARDERMGEPLKA